MKQQHLDINKCNASERQLWNFLNHLKSPERIIHLSLRPQGMETVIFPNAINLAQVEGHGQTYFFGGISESFYDSMVQMFDSRELIAED